MGEKNKVHLTVMTLSGNYADDFNIHQKLQHVIEETFKKLNIVPATGEVWILKYNNAALDANRTIQDAGLPDGAQLELAPVEGGGGAWIQK